MEKLIQVSHLRRYIREPAHRAKIAPTVERIVASSKLPSGPRPTINYILGGPTDDQYQSKHQRRKLLRAATVQAQVNIISTPDSAEQYNWLEAPYPFLPLTRPGSSLHTTMHLCLLYALTILMCTKCLLTLETPPTCYSFPPLGR